MDWKMWETFNRTEGVVVALAFICTAGGLPTKKLQDGVSLRQMHWKTWESFNGPEGAVAAFTCTVGGPPPKPALGNGLLQTHGCENLGNIQWNRGCIGGLHLHSRGSSSKDSSRTWSPSDTWIGKPGKQSIEQRGQWWPSSAQQWVLLQRAPGHGLPQTNALENLGIIQWTRGCGGGLGLHLHSRGLPTKKPQDRVSVRQMKWKTWEIFNGTGLVPRVPGQAPQLHRMASSLCRSSRTLAVIPVQQEGKSSLKNNTHPWREETFRKIAGVKCIWR
ncbi:uncharacterized protein LOC127542560 [Antechinus flavipes]|uniref:uncharacterized protein LOC127542560 n=1 Tax=Antechinus flavipes TaxID=38775 RepID=UPI002235F2B4|nr:uncharacterized protein LOC127542560 [Antechinus flavipes]